MASALLLCRTPLQAHIMVEVLRIEGIDQYDFLYFTSQNSIEDMACFELLAAGASLAEYVHVTSRRFDILTHLQFRMRASYFLKDIKRDMVVIGSLNNIVFNSILQKQLNSILVTVDDGAANIVSDSIYLSDVYGGRMDYYRFLFGAHDLRTTRSRISRHYTIFPEFENIVPRGLLRPVNLGISTNELTEPGPIFFIGQPFSEIISQDQIKKLTLFLNTQKIDYYVPHPREVDLLKIDAKTLDKYGLIAEQAILKQCMNSKPTIIGLSSTVLFTISAERANKKMLIFHESEGDDIVNKGLLSGCSIVRIVT